MGLRKRTSKGAGMVVGLDLDPTHVAAAEVHVNGSITVERSAVVALPAGVLRDGEVTDAGVLTKAIKDMWAEHGFGKTVRLGVASQRIVVRAIDLPPLQEEKAIAAAVRVEAPDHIPMPMDEAVLDFQSLGVVDTPTGKRTRVVIVAVRRELVERLSAAVTDAGLKLEGIDLSAFAFVRSLHNKITDADVGMLYVNAAGLTNVAVTSGEHCVFTRAAAGGLDQMVNTLADRRGLTSEHAVQWLTHVGLSAPVESLEGDPEVIVAARAVLEEGVHQLADTVRNSLNFYRMQAGATPVERAVLTGPAVDIPGLTQRLSESLGMPTEARTVAGRGDLVSASRLGVAAGLAVASL